jgi:AsmA family protein
MSTHLNLADLAPALGSRVGRTQPQSNGIQSNGLLLPDADLQVNRVRGMDADVTFKSQSVISSKIPLRHVQFHLLLENGVLRLDPLSVTLPQGQLAGRVQIDASKNVPQSDIEMHLENVDLAQFKPASATDSPMEGMLAGRLKLHGNGSSVHKFASSAHGVLGMVIPHGQIRALFVELTGIDVARALGLVLTQNRLDLSLQGRSKKSASAAVAFANPRGRQSVEAAGRYQAREGAIASRYGDPVGDVVDAHRGHSRIC